MSETWIKESVSSYTMLENYQMLCHAHRKNKKGGGVAIYTKNNLDFNKIDVLSTSIEDVMQIVTVYICIKQLKKIVICCIYISPSVNYNDFNSKLKILFDKFQFSTKDVYVCLCLCLCLTWIL